MIVKQHLPVWAFRSTFDFTQQAMNEDHCVSNIVYKPEKLKDQPVGLTITQTVGTTALLGGYFLQIL